MGGYVENDSVSNYMWETLVQENTENTLQQAQEDNEQIPLIHKNYLTPDEQLRRKLHDVNDEII